MKEHITRELQLINYPHINEMVELILNIYSISSENGVGIYEVIESIRNNTYQELSDMTQSDKEIIIKLLENKPLSPISINDKWEQLGIDLYAHSRLFRLMRKGNDRPYYLDAVECITQRGNVLRLSSIKVGDKNYSLYGYPKDINNLPTVIINIEEQEIYRGYWEMTTTETEIDKVREFYDVVEVEEVIRDRNIQTLKINDRDSMPTPRMFNNSSAVIVGRKEFGTDIDKITVINSENKRGIVITDKEGKNIATIEVDFENKDISPVYVDSNYFVRD